ncbi:MAG: PLP-dependent transferase [Candidatus Lokiarchaeota archaeon]|nr:PLP-dependent transferase [Candidatus Lokiarchaeota archaeon]
MNENIKLKELRDFEPIGGIHGISVVFPKFQDIIDYEEQKTRINQGYPRFVMHPYIKKIEEEYRHKYNCKDVFVFHNYNSAVFIVVDYFYRNYEKIFSNEGLQQEIYSFLENKFQMNKSTIKLNAEVLLLDAKNFKNNTKFKNKKIICLFSKNNINFNKIDNIDLIVLQNKKYNIGIIISFKEEYQIFNLLRRHTGFITSSRKLEGDRILNKNNQTLCTKNVQKRISALEKTSPNNCFLYPSGMAAIFSSIYSIISPDKPNFITLGSLYVDTIRILEKWLVKYNLNKPLFITENILDNLEKNIDHKTAGIILEIPSNPLIQIIDLEKVVNLAHEFDCKVIVDSTIASPYNINPFDFNVDIIIHSTTKFLSGKNNHIGGVLLVNNEDLQRKIKNFNKILQLEMFSSEIEILNENLINFELRMKIINANSIKIAQFLDNHEAVGHVNYPLLKNNPYNHLIKKYLKGGSGLISFILKNSTFENAEKFYNNVAAPILKGPSLGSEATLLSPYVIMAHYGDSEKKLEQLGLDKFLMRISIGTEPYDQIIDSLKQGLNALE